VQRVGRVVGADPPPSFSESDPCRIRGSATRVAYESRARIQDQRPRAIRASPLRANRHTSRVRGCDLPGQPKRCASTRGRGHARRSREQDLRRDVGGPTHRRPEYPVADERDAVGDTTARLEAKRELPCRVHRRRSHLRPRTARAASRLQGHSRTAEWHVPLRAHDLTRDLDSRVPPSGHGRQGQAHCGLLRHHEDRSSCRRVPRVVADAECDRVLTRLVGPTREA
jgi:hypothetical protein